MTRSKKQWVVAELVLMQILENLSRAAETPQIKVPPPSARHGG
jgi:hypothetical protein